MRVGRHERRSRPEAVAPHPFAPERRLRRRALKPSPIGRGALCSHRAPLFRHRLRDARKEPRPLLPTIWRRRHVMDPRFPTAHDICRDQGWQLLQPKTGSFGLAMPELPRLDALGEVLEIRDAGLGVFVHDRIFDGDPIDGRVPEVGKQRGPFIELCPHLFDSLASRRHGQPADTGIAQSGAGRVGDHQKVPAVVQQVAGIADDMAVRSVFTRQQVA